jgi:DNA-binding response OmpR family regulator
MMLSSTPPRGREGAGTAGDPRNAAPTILIVDDDATLWAALGSVLSSYGYRVLTAASSESAYSLLGSTSVDALILDVRLPTMSGLALYLAVVSRWPALRESIAFLTADADEPDVRTWLDLHRCTVFRKPCPVGNIIAWVGTATERQNDERRASS